MVDFLMEKGYVIEQLPCPEILHMGVRRWWCTKDLYDTPGFRKTCMRLAKATVDLMEHYLNMGYNVAVIGVDGSPSCGINLTGRNPSWGGRPRDDVGEYRMVEEMGVWMEELSSEIERRGLKPIPLIGVKEDEFKADIEEALRKLEIKLKE